MQEIAKSGLSSSSLMEYALDARINFEDSFNIGDVVASGGDGSSESIDRFDSRLSKNYLKLYIERQKCLCFLLDRCYPKQKAF